MFRIDGIILLGHCTFRLAEACEGTDVCAAWSDQCLTVGSGLTLTEATRCSSIRTINIIPEPGVINNCHQRSFEYLYLYHLLHTL